MLSYCLFIFVAPTIPTVKKPMPLPPELHFMSKVLVSPQQTERTISAPGVLISGILIYTHCFIRAAKHWNILLLISIQLHMYDTNQEADKLTQTRKQLITLQLVTLPLETDGWNDIGKTIDLTLKHTTALPPAIGITLERSSVFNVYMTVESETI